MKKINVIASVLLCVLLCFALVGCNDREELPQNAKVLPINPQEDLISVGDVLLDTSSEMQQPDFSRVTPTFQTYLPQNTSERSDLLAEQALLLCSANEKSADADNFRAAGLEVLSQYNYEKPSGDVSHTCAYTMGKKSITYGGETRTLVVVDVRGTTDGEWFSNFDVAPSGREDSVFAENFLAAATELQLKLDDELRSQAIVEPLLLVCGHSRGGAVANLLSLFVNAKYGKNNVFVYTFATPRTVKSTYAADCSNVFNYVNEADVVTKMPLEKWGFTRLGTDIVLKPNEDHILAEVEDCISILQSVAPSITVYYGSRYSLLSGGTSADGITPYELMLCCCTLMDGGMGEASSLVTSLNAVSSESAYAQLFQKVNYFTKNLSQAVLLGSQHLQGSYHKQILSLISAEV